MASDRDLVEFIVDQINNVGEISYKKLHFFVEDQFGDSEWISHVIKTTAEELPPPKPRKSMKSDKK